MAVYIIEHLEPEMYEWCVFEYESISKIVGKENLWITNVKKDGEKISKFGRVFKEKVFELNLKNACVLDMESNKELIPAEAKKFDYFIFGGILGDYPPKKRTEKELSKFLPCAEKRNIGKEQFPTDNAVYVVKEIASGKKLSEMKFANEFALKVNKIEEMVLPFRYILVNGKPLISKKVVNYLKKHPDFEK